MALRKTDTNERALGGAESGRARSEAKVEGHPDLVWREVVRGSKPGDRFVKIATHQGFKHMGPGYIMPHPNAPEPQGTGARVLNRTRRLLIGRPIPTRLEAQERLTKIKALAVFSSDALSSVAYATEEIMKVLVLGGLGLLSLTMPVSITIVLLMAIVVISYRQTIKAYPSGGGSYIVASDNLGTTPGLTAAAALLIDYVLTVAVSVAAGVAAITSLAPGLLPYTVVLSVVAVLFIVVANLRGIRESGTIFAAPTYVFILLMYALIVFGLYKLTTGGIVYVPPASALKSGGETLGIFLLMSAFAQGCSAMTGTEAISNGVPAFRKPEYVNARATIVWMGTLLGSMFIGISYLAAHMGVLPATDETVLSQIGRTIFGAGPLWYALQIATALILILAANTSFADFPRLSSILARDRFLPRTFQFRGDRLAFTVGIASLAALSIVLLVIFGGSVDHLIPLYAVGVFTSFTLSQAGMVVHWRKVQGPNWKRSAVINGVGAVATGIVTLVIASTKFVHGAWLVVLLIPLLIGLMKAINSHYKRIERARETELPLLASDVRIRTVVPVADLGVEARQALSFARAITRVERDVVAVHVADEEADGKRFQGDWEEAGLEASLIIIESPYRSLLGPLLSYVDALKDTYPRDTITVVLPEFVPTHWWERLIHNQTALRIKSALWFHPGIVVINVPYRLSRKGAPVQEEASHLELQKTRA